MTTFTKRGNRDKRLAQGNYTLKRRMQIKCMQLNLQHSRTATYNLSQIIIQNNIEVAFLQEPTPFETM